MINSSLRLCLFAVAASGLAANALAVTVFSDNFDSPTNTAWTVNVAPAANAAQQQATFGYDYSEMGIPAAPGSENTVGLRLRSNIPGSADAPVTTRPTGVLSGLSLSPTGMDFGSRYSLSFYAWANFIGAPNAQGLADNTNSQGGTFNVLAAVGTSGAVPVVVGNTLLASGASMDGIGFATTSDGGIGSDYRIYPQSGIIVPAGSNYAAGVLASNNAFYTSLFPAKTAPEIQQAISTAEYDGDAANTQAGLTQPGAFGFAWHKVEILQDGGLATWKINDTTIATYDASALTLGGNIAIGMSDVNTSTTRHPSLVFTLFDNLQVSTLPNAGDFNLDGLVDAADYTVWRDNFGANETVALGTSGDGSGIVDEGDYTLWTANYGKDYNASAAGSVMGSSVPEPSSLLLLLAVIPVCCGCRR